MKTKSYLREVFLITLALLPFVYLAFRWEQLPETIVTHYDLRGEADGWMPKHTATLVMGLVSSCIYLLLRFLPQIDPKGFLQSGNYPKLRVVVTGLLAFVTAWMWYMASHRGPNHAGLQVLLAVISLLLAGMGNYITTLKPNWFVGIRTPWTLENEVVWRKTHRMGGYLLVAGGLTSTVLAFVVPMPYTVGVVLGVITLVSLLPVVYSYIFFQQEKARQLN